MWGTWEHEKYEEQMMTTRMLGSVGALAVFAAVGARGGILAAAQGGSNPPPLVVTAFGGDQPQYKVPRTAWGDPDQGAWSSDDMSNIPMSRPNSPSGCTSTTKSTRTASRK